MSQPSLIQINLLKLEEIKKANPSATHVYLRRCNKDNAVVDIPIAQAEFTIRNQPAWELVTSNKQMDDAVEALFAEPENDEATQIEPEEELVVPPKPSEEAEVAAPETMPTIESATETKSENTPLHAEPSKRTPPRKSKRSAAKRKSNKKA